MAWRESRRSFPGSCDSIWLGAGPWPTRRGPPAIARRVLLDPFHRRPVPSGPFGAHCHAGHYSLSEREREIAVCIITSKWHSACPSNAHERRGKEVGLPTDMIEALIEGLQTSFPDGITDAITLMGHYTGVSMTLAFYDVPAGATGMAR